MKGENMLGVLTGKVMFLDKKYKEAAECFLEGAREGDAESAFHYGYMLMNGIGVEQNPKEAVRFFNHARGQMGEANYNLAVLYLHGVGVSRDYEKCYYYMREAAVQGVVEAQIYLGVAHSMGSLFEPDIIAISMIPYHTPIYRDPYAYIEGNIGYDVEDEQMRIRASRLDPYKAFEFFRAAALNKNYYTKELVAKSRYLYARCFLDGLGVEANREEGDRVMLIAAASGSDEAMHYISTEAPYLLTDNRYRDITKYITANNFAQNNRLGNRNG